MKKLCFVCTGNACRSPFAECVLKDMLMREKIAAVQVCSVGTLNWGLNPRDSMMCRVARQQGYFLTGSTQFMSKDILSSADIIVIFEKKHRDEITRVLDYAHWNKIVLFNNLAFGKNTEVADPHMQTEAIYKMTAAEIIRGCEHIITFIKKGLSK